MRTEVSRVGGVVILNDAYNANPGSAIAAVEALETMPATGRRIAVFGEMRELGRHSAALHRKVAERLRDSNVNQRIARWPHGRPDGRNTAKQAAVWTQRWVLRLRGGFAGQTHRNVAGR